MSRVFPSQEYTGRPAYWWTPEIANLVEACREADQLRNISPNHLGVAAEVQQTRNGLKTAIKASKKQFFECMVLAMHNDETGQLFRKVLYRMKPTRTAQERDPAVLERVVSTLFPEHPPAEWPTIDGNEAGNMVPLREITDPELQTIASSMHPKKAPGLDGVPNAALAVAITKYPGPFRQVYQECLNMSCFPQQWKKQRLVLLPKPGKPPGDPSSFRPLCLLDNAGKAFERLLLNRLNEHLENPENPKLSEHQYGFRRGRSTLLAIQQVVNAGRRAMSFGRTNNRDRRCLMVVALDVRNAFNTANWQCIAEALREKGVPLQLRSILQDYFTNRELTYDTAEGPVTRRVSAGCPQGSILGPTLWNVGYDGVLRLDFPEGAQIVGFADDLAILAAGTTPEHAARIAEEAVELVHAWMRQHHLQLAPEKTECVMISSLRRGHPEIPMRVGGVEIRSKQAIRYLGVMIHDHLLWRPHVKMVVDKASRVVRVVTNVMRNPR